jgi:4a-hydroxytetrahydrobiopterin dehydratase
VEQTSTQPDERLTRQEVSDAISGLGWRFVLGLARTIVQVDSLRQAAEVAACAVAAAGDHADEHLSLDLRPGRVLLTLQTEAQGWVTRYDIEAATRISAAIANLGLVTDPDVTAGGARTVQEVWIAIDGLDIPAIRPFWKAIMGYADEPGWSDPDANLIDPLGQQPAIWFQQMDAPRPQRNRIHFDISVPHDEASRRVRNAVAAGGTILRDDAPAFWVLSDAEGNEACITTWQGKAASTARAWGVQQP